MATKTKAQRTASRQRQLVAALQRGQTVVDAAKVAGVSRSTVYKWWETDAEFKRLCASFLEFRGVELQAVAYNLALGGNEKMLIFLLSPRGRAVAEVASGSSDGEGAGSERVGRLEIVGLEESKKPGSQFIEFVTD